MAKESPINGQDPFEDRVELATQKAISLLRSKCVNKEISKLDFMSEIGKVFTEYGLDPEQKDFDKIEIEINNLDCYVVESLSIMSFEEFSAIFEGTWSLPHTQEKAQNLKDLIDRLEKNPDEKYGGFDGHGVSHSEKELYHLLGNDSLFDILGSLEDKGELTNAKAAAEIKKSLEEFLNLYEEDPDNFKDKFSKNALEILKSIF